MRNWRRETSESLCSFRGSFPVLGSRHNFFVSPHGITDFSGTARETFFFLFLFFYDTETGGKPSRMVGRGYS